MCDKEKCILNEETIKRLLDTPLDEHGMIAEIDGKVYTPVAMEKKEIGDAVTEILEKYPRVRRIVIDIKSPILIW